MKKTVKNEELPRPLIEFKRSLNLQDILKRKGLFLLGPRQTGKTSYLKKNFPQAKTIDLLKNELFAEYVKNPENLRKMIELWMKKDPSSKITVIIDEVQKIPELLNEVHSLIENFKGLRFILTGSSARKLKAKGINLLGGRVTLQYFHPITFPELKLSGMDFELVNILTYGLLPGILNSPDPYSDLLDYVGLYLREEIKYEGLVRNLNLFSDFLNLAANSNTEQIVYSSFASDAQLSVPTIKEYFQILEDTLVGHHLPPFMHTKKRKAQASFKFYFFDCGVVNGILGRKSITEGTIEFGKQLEQYIFQEIQAYINFQRLKIHFEYWRNKNQDEVDFIIYENLSDIVAIEVKGKKKTSHKDFQGLLKLKEEFPKLKPFLVYMGNTSYLESTLEIEILSVNDFLTELWAKKIF
jgi:predicted AAA+ superfamily ATPase